ncbi:response regulator [Trichothermofontia sp.]
MMTYTSPIMIDSGMAQRLPLRILLAEDVIVNQRVALRMLNRLGYQADTALNGEEVLQALRCRAYDVIFLDVQMPRMGGLETAQRIRNEWPPAERPWLVAMTAHALAGDRESCLQAGMDDYVSKPIRFETLVAALKRCAMQRRE